MHCSRCGSENPARKKYCSKCGAELSRRCAQCGAESAAAARFCGECGVSLGPPSADSLSATQPAETRQIGERRHLTILFCDLVGSTTLAAQLDPEEWRATVAGYQRAAAEAITRFGGEVMRYVGDGIMAFFGYPVAHDNDAERAARAALGILDAIPQLSQQPADAKLAVRIGIDSGRVVVGTGSGNAVDAFGDAANIAARVQSVAEPGTVVITGETHRLISGLFVVEELGAQTLKGIEQPVQVYRVIRPSGMRGRFEAVSAAGGLTPFIGREDELRALKSRWEHVLDGEGQVALIIGEAGIGKSRLLQRFHEQIAGRPHTWLEAGAGPFFQNTPFYPITELLRQLLSDAPVQDQIAQLASRLTAVGLAPAEGIPLIAPLLNLPLPPEYPPLALSPEQQRRRLLATLVEWVLGGTKAQPLVIAIEDLHWADPSTLELIQLLVEQGATARLLLLLTARPEFRAPWAMRAHHAQITLNRLSARDVRTMVSEVAARKALSDETVATVVERTGGVPLFVEELTRAVLESGDGKLVGHEIPATLHDSLMARLDRLGGAKEIIQVGAVIGSDFSYELLQAVHPIAEADLQRALRSLTDAELLYVRGIAPEATYQFKHALIRDAAYEALLKSRRKELHRMVARTIDEQFPALKDTHPEVLAHHFSLSGDSRKAVEYCVRACKQSLNHGAMAEAVTQFDNGVELLLKLPDDGERAEVELELRNTVFLALLLVKGSGSRDVEQSILRGLELARTPGLDWKKAQSALLSLFWYELFHNARKASEIAEELVTQAEAHGDPEELAVALDPLGWTRMDLGDFAGAAEVWDRAMRLLDATPNSAPTPRHLALMANNRSPSAVNHWFRGYADQALERLNEAIAIAEESGDKTAVRLALNGMMLLHLFRGELEHLQSRAEANLALTSELGDRAHRAQGEVFLGWTRAMMGDREGGIAGMRHHLAEYTATGAEYAREYYLALIANALAIAGRLDESLLTFDESISTIERTGLRLFEAEVHRLKGEALLMQAPSNAAAAETCFRTAIAISCKQGAKSWELRATTSLARLLAKRGNRDEARTMLAEIYTWFTEGFDTADLKDARALLDRLDSES